MEEAYSMVHLDEAKRRKKKKCGCGGHKEEECKCDENLTESYNLDPDFVSGAKMFLLTVASAAGVALYIGRHSLERVAEKVIAQINLPEDVERLKQLDEKEKDHSITTHEMIERINIKAKLYQTLGDSFQDALSKEEGFVSFLRKTVNGIKKFHNTLTQKVAEVKNSLKKV